MSLKPDSVTAIQLRQAIGGPSFGLSDDLIDYLAQHICQTFFRTCRVVPQALGWSTDGSPCDYKGVSTGQPHRPGDYRHVGDFLDALAEGRTSEDGNPANFRLRTIRDQLGIPLLMTEYVAKQLQIDHKRIVEKLASDPCLYDWWCDAAETCERVIGAMPMSALLFKHSARARAIVDQAAQEKAAYASPSPKHQPTDARRSSSQAAYKMQENRINGLCRHVWSQFQGQALTAETGTGLQQALAAIRDEHGAKVTRSVVVRLRTQYDPASHWCSRELWRQVFEAHIPLDTGTQ
ncbi:hypothetical protein [Modicisalibacter luteus]|uniref:Uncharacterized protein n=1 Tax=Modicisalibacter luteus TaxID=453962 RepID=A0ABV7LX42_9GAMM|nr:hypothetical protein [Halomonas lutea]